MAEIQALFRSRLQIQILLALSEGTRTLTELRDATGSSSQALIPKIRSLESQMLVKQKQYGYFLTPLGQVLTTRIIDFMTTLGVIRKHKEFWGNHDISGIPPEFLSDIGKLFESQIVHDTTEDVIHVYTLFLKIIREADYIYGASSVMSPGLAEALSGRIREGTTVELIVNEEAAEKLQLEPYASEMKDLLSYSNFRVMVAQVPFRIGLTVTDKCISLGLFKADGKMYDSGSDLYSDNPQAITWGEQLFKFFRDQSEEIQLE